MLRNKDLDLLVLGKLGNSDLITICFPPLNKTIQRIVPSSFWKERVKHLSFLRTKKYKGFPKKQKRISWKQLFYEFHYLILSRKQDLLYCFAKESHFSLPSSYISSLKGSFWRKQIQKDFDDPAKIVRRSTWKECYLFIYVLRNELRFPFKSGDPDFYRFILGGMASFSSASIGNIITNCLQLGYQDLAECIQQLYE